MPGLASMPNDGSVKSIGRDVGTAVVRWRLTRTGCRCFTMDTTGQLSALSAGSVKLGRAILTQSPLKARTPQEKVKEHAKPNKGIRAGSFVALHHTRDHGETRAMAFGCNSSKGLRLGR